MPSEPDIDRAVEVLRGGGLVALPTETVYGLAADAENALAVRRVFAVKGRPERHPVIVHVASSQSIDGWARDIPSAARKLAERFWPGPLTLVLRRSERASDTVTGGQDTVGLRVPNHPIALALLTRFGGGLAAPSANRFGKVSPTRAEHVRADLGDDVDCVLDGGPCAVGVESTIIDLTGPEPRLLRLGGVEVAAIEATLGAPLVRDLSGAPRAPGLLPSHYAPRAGVVLAQPSEVGHRMVALLAEGKRVAVLAPTEGRITLPIGVTSLSVPADATGLARVLYARLRDADAAGVDVVVVQVPGEEGLGAAVLDRLARAAAR